MEHPTNPPTVAPAILVDLRDEEPGWAAWEEIECLIGMYCLG
jgi:hypothetical protein